MDLRQLEMLLAVVDSGSYAKAGERLHVSHSAVHRQVRLLEHEVQDRILVQAGRRVKLTETGAILASLARRMRQEVSAAERQIAGRNQLNSGHLRIGTGTTMLVFFLPPILDRFRREHPGIEVQVITGTADHVLEQIRVGQLDAGVILASRDMPVSEPSFIREVLYREEFVLAVNENHPLARKKTVPVDRLTEFPFIVHSKSSHVRRVLDRICAEAGFTPKISMELENEEAMETMIEINMGMAIMAKCRAVSDKLQYLRIAGRQIFCEVTLVFANSEYMPRTVKEFSRLCREFSGAH